VPTSMASVLEHCGWAAVWKIGEGDIKTAFQISVRWNCRYSYW